MQIKERKRKISPEQEFTVVAKDEPSLEIIKQKAMQKAIKVFPRGHAKNRLFFRCVPEKKTPFLSEIKSICSWEPAVTPPNSILRGYRRALLKTAVNRLDKDAAEAAMKLLTEQITDNGNAETAAQTNGEPAETVINDKPAVNIKQNSKLSIPESVIRVVKSGMNWVRSLIKPQGVVVTVPKWFGVLKGKNK